MKLGITKTLKANIKEASSEELKMYIIQKIKLVRGFKSEAEKLSREMLGGDRIFGSKEYHTNQMDEAELELRIRENAKLKL